MGLHGDHCIGLSERLKTVEGFPEKFEFPFLFLAGEIELFVCFLCVYVATSDLYIQIQGKGLKLTSCKERQEAVNFLRMFFTRFVNPREEHRRFLGPKKIHTRGEVS